MNMGACYSVSLKIKFNKENEKKILEEMEKCYQTHLFQRVGFCIEEYDFEKPSTIQDYLDLYFVKHQDIYTNKVEEFDNGSVEYSVNSSFDASYSWEIVMCDFFKEIAKYLLCDSILEMWPDNYHTIYRVKDGQVY